MEQQVVLRTKEMQLLEAAHGKPIDQILRELYVDQGLNVDQVGARIGQTKGTVSRWLDRFDIPTRKRGQRADSVA